MIDSKFHENLKSWPFIEAIKIINNFGGLDNFNIPEKNYILFENSHLYSKKR